MKLENDKDNQDNIPKAVHIKESEHVTTREKSMTKSNEHPYETEQDIPNTCNTEHIATVHKNIPHSSAQTDTVLSTGG